MRKCIFNADTLWEERRPHSASLRDCQPTNKCPSLILIRESCRKRHWTGFPRCSRQFLFARKERVKLVLLDQADIKCVHFVILLQLIRKNGGRTSRDSCKCLGKCHLKESNLMKEFYQLISVYAEILKKNQSQEGMLVCCVKSHLLSAYRVLIL